MFLHVISKRFRGVCLALITACIVAVCPYTRVVIRDVLLIISIGGHGSGQSVSINDHIEHMAKCIRSLAESYGHVLPNQDAYNRIERVDLVRLYPQMRGWPRVYTCLSQTNFVISVKVRNDLPDLCIDEVHSKARFVFSDAASKKAALRKFIDSLKLKPVTSMTRHSDIICELPLLEGFGYSEESIYFLTERINDRKEAWTVRGVAREVREAIIKEHKDIGTNCCISSKL